MTILLRLQIFTRGDMFSYRLTPTGEFGKVYLAYDASAAKHITFTDEIGVNGASSAVRRCTEVDVRYTVRIVA
ncbi:MAG: hypothetical protein L6V93_17015 [Clostridiales bacterium]|nr:MAG: hypothetical protein L6V93_17015 [Clostridiales bacterium]